MKIKLFLEVEKHFKWTKELKNYHINKAQIYMVQEKTKDKEQSIKDILKSDNQKLQSKIFMIIEGK